MIKKVYDNVYMSIFPLTGNPLREINIFIIKDKDEAMIIDTGFNNEENRANMDQIIEELELDLGKTSLFLTHLHSDHVGLAKYLEDKGIKQIFMSETDGYLLDHGISIEDLQWQNVLANAKMQGLIGQAKSAENLDINDHPGYKNRPKEKFSKKTLKPGDRLDFGDFHFEILDETGHTPGMVGLYDKEKSLLFCGDHILGKITPNITYWGEEYGDCLGKYLTNIKNLKKENIKTLFSSHRHLVEDTNKRIDELISHHKKRLEETMDIIKEHGPINTTEISKNMHWDISAKRWSDFPSSQKWFAVGEASAHVIHLKSQGLIREEIIDGVAYYRKN